VLLELRVQNLLLIESAELVLDPGLNVITGETGAGKTVLAQALDLLLGGKPKRGVVRPGADEAYVEGLFATPPALADDPSLAELAERLPLDAEELVLARRVTAAGRTRAYLQGRSVTAPELAAVGARLLSFFGQHEHRRLVLSSAQLAILDAFCGREQLERRERFERTLASARGLERELAALRERLGVRERDLDLLEFEIAEIEEAVPSEAERAELERERTRLAAVETLREAAGAAATAIEPEGEPGAGGALASVALARARLDAARGADAELDALASRTESLAYELDDLGRELRGYLAGLDADPARLQAVEERLDVYSHLERKHGGSVATVLAHAEHCRAERDRLANAGAETDRLESELAGATAALEELAAALGDARMRGGEGLARAVAGELAELAMPDAGFEVAVEPRAAGGRGPLDRYAPTGADAVEFLIAPNPGVPAGPLREIASGGELSRVMLALMSVATGSAHGAGTVVFDEVDAGVGGATARAVGERLRALASERQVLCITHLPQVASLAARNFRVAKQAAASRKPALTTVERLERSQLVGELCRMLGADSADLTARRHAERLLEAA